MVFSGFSSFKVGCTGIVPLHIAKSLRASCIGAMRSWRELATGSMKAMIGGIEEVRAQYNRTKYAKTKSTQDYIFKIYVARCSPTQVVLGVMVAEFSAEPSQQGATKLRLIEHRQGSNPGVTQHWESSEHTILRLRAQITPEELSAYKQEHYLIIRHCLEGQLK